jgi:hypothetical protein
VGDQRVREFCENLFGLAAAYMDKVPMRYQTVALGTHTVSIRMPDVEFQCNLDPFESLMRLSESPATSDFDIVCIDARSSIPLPEGGWPSTWHGPVGLMADYRSEPFRLAIDRHTQAISVFHPGWCRGVIWMWDITLMPYWAAATPWRLMLSWCADTFDGEFIHAACVTHGGTGTLLVGPSGAGKSTLALTASEEGFGLIGDDFILVHENFAFPVYRRAKAHNATLRLLDDSWIILNPERPGEKGILDITSKVNLIPSAGVHITAAAIPDMSREVRFSMISPGVVLRQSAPYSLSGLFGGTRRSLLRAKRIFQSLHGFTLPVARSRAEDLGGLRRIHEFAQDD